MLRSCAAMLCFGVLLSAWSEQGRGEEKSAAAGTRVYRNTLKKLENPAPILADHPKFIQAAKGHVSVVASVSNCSLSPCT